MGRIFLGGEGFVERLKSQLADVETLPEIPKAERFAARPGLDSFFGSGPLSRQEKDHKIYQAYRAYGYTQKEIADFLGVHYATVTRAIKRVENEMLDCKTPKCFVL